MFEITRLIINFIEFSFFYFYFDKIKLGGSDGYFYEDLEILNENLCGLSLAKCKISFFEKTKSRGSAHKKLVTFWKKILF